MLLDPALLLSYLAVATVLALSPGLDALFVLAAGLENSRAGAVAASIGVSAGTVVHTLAASVGISTVVAANPYAFDVLRVAGAVYLAYLGYQAFRRVWQKNLAAVYSAPDTALDSTQHLFLRGLLTNLLNPKVILFYIALLPQFVSLELGNIALQILLLGVLHTLIGLVFLVSVSLTAVHVSERIRAAGFMRWISAFAGFCYFGLALRLIILEKN